jgi:hypothetical protein
MQEAIDEKPALTTWQVGTNAVWENYKLGDVDTAIKTGLDRLKNEQATMDVNLMDLQYAPAVLTENKIDATRRMLSLITQRAAEAGVSVFRRFDLMRKFIEIERHSFDTIIDPADEYRLHQSDFATGRVSYELCQLITAAAIAASAEAAPPA